MKNIFSKLCIISFLVLLSSLLSAQPEIREYSLNEDTQTIIKLRTTNVPAELAQKKAFDYTGEQSEAPVSFWQKILNFIIDSLSQMMLSPVWRVIFYIIISGFMLFIIIKLLGYQYSGFWLRGRKTKGFAAEEIYEENLLHFDFDKAIKKAIEEHDFRLAVRFRYLHLLKEMTTAEIIDWKPDKTNIEYQQEINKTALGKDFRSLTRIYEYAWYGDFPVSEKFYKQTENKFSLFFNSVKQLRL
ncbi:MAG: DUF4129 domain-containing protein [Bacteroidota bacterium]|nr:DUF4129 domain-containing protein [Bacteroidota bacterium]